LGLVLIFDRGFKIIPSYWQSISEVLHKFTLELVKENIAHERAEYFFPWVLTIFALLLSMNLIGLVTYSFTLTSHIIVTFTIALGAFLGVNYVALKKHGLKALKIFLPAGGHFALVFILVPIELISYFFKPISLALRLFANMMAGHSLLKIFVLVVDTIMEIKYPYGFFLTFVPLFFLVILFFLELIVTVIQAYVFAVIISMYINDALNVY
jgi:F-type H+-transporting ATPase subunit a